MTEIYACPMHPGVTSKPPGKCSKCGMALVGGGQANKEEMDHSLKDHTKHHQMMAADFKKRFFVTLPLTIVILLLSPQIQKWFGISFEFAGRELVLFVLGSIVAIYGGKPFFQAAKDEIRSRNWGMMTLVSLAIVAGYSFSVAATFLFSGESLWWEISTLVLVFLFGHWVEMKAVLGTGGTLKELAKLIPPKAHKFEGNDVLNVPTEQLVAGDMVLVKPGEKIPVDGVVVKGESSVNESVITGESKSIEKEKGDEVIGGTINNSGSLTVRVTKTGSDSALSQIMELISIAQVTKPAVQNLADRAANWLTIIAILIGSATFVYWMFINPVGTVGAATFAISVIVITCPHALGLAIPTVTTIASSLAAKNGVLIRDMKGLEVARRLDYVVFDKTGTLTKGEFVVSEVVTFGKSTKKEVLTIASTVEIHSEHPIAKAIVMKAKERNLSSGKMTNFKAVSGKGVRASLGKSRIVLGNLGMLRQEGVNVEINQVVESIGTAVYVAKNKILLGAIVLEDEIRPESKEVVKELHNIGIKVAMLSGDKKKVAEDVGKKLKIDTVYSEVLPVDKVEKIKELQDKGFTVAMVGDGVNDAPSLTQAHAGIAIGAGTSVAIESAEVVLVKDNLLDVLKVINLSIKTDRKMKQNLAWATGYNVVAIPVAAGVFASFGLILQPHWGALLMSISSVIVVANAIGLRSAKL
ncbi:heavy metal translocating P-type ATPase [Patescibacteria group bacterium]